MERSPLRVVQIGLGPIGQGMVREIAARSRLELVAAVDINPKLKGADAGTVSGLDQPAGVRVVSSLEELGADADLACVTTGSDLNAVVSTLVACCERGLGVVSTCEELSYPWDTAADLAHRIDEAARGAGVAVLGTGVNPGFVMDLLPVVATGPCSRVESIRVERFQDASKRRLPFQAKIGAGLDRDAFEANARGGSIRHVGLTESMHMIARRLGWEIECTSDQIEPVMHGERVAGLHQVGRAWSEGRIVIELDFHAEMGLADPRDRIIVRGVPALEMVVPGGIHGDIATCAITVNCMPLIVDARTGLRTMIDIDPVSCFR